ncbi:MULTISPECIES: hypothetical protein [Chryseobacterium]|uniref:DUF2846 domain-containing protein n=1 Tax=Chryseobacterium rhizosphaerae TaxID=395937 RepID=A0AAE3Y7I7_9FLAO|nr:MULTISPECIES: hypothetical protein [Chryseobacterium]MBL3549199.1 hypothetical protein [Chryseobacterium sp. KMC2]MDC8100463.1 hypothetical protein [Chryseobacterium rhizosphaerae]MDR6525360.1 hypothetical protein [Chryseobacterium rhizosphaerae]MDR6545716.1 hypothetical protein [Chryseobacterium rhizosphaerae]
MKITIKQIFKLGLLASVLTLSSCALRSVPSDYSSVRLDVIDNNTLGNGKVLIYNGAGVLHKMDNTARLNIGLDGKSLGQIRPKEYVIVNLENGKHEFTALHIDMVNMRSKHPVEINASTKVIKIEPTITSNKLTVTNILPENFDKYIERPETR